MDKLYSMIADHLRGYKRRFTVVDLGCGGGELLRRISKDFDAVCIAVDKDLYATEGYDGFEDYPRMLALKWTFTSNLIREWASCSRFDVVLALNILHWYPFQLDEILNGIRELADWSFIQVPKPEDTGAINHEMAGGIIEEVKLCGGVYLGETERYPRHMTRPVYRMEGLSTILTRTLIGAIPRTHQGNASRLQVAGGKSRGRGVAQLHPGRGEIALDRRVRGVGV